MSEIETVLIRRHYDRLVYEKFSDEEILLVARALANEAKRRIANRDEEQDSASEL